MKDKPICFLVNEEFETRNLIGAVNEALKLDDRPIQANEFIIKALKCKLYRDVMQLAQEYVTLK